MKKFITIFLVAITVASCFPTYDPPTIPSRSRLRNTATYTGVAVQPPVVPPLIADLDVAKEKIRHNEFPSEALLRTEFENILNTAIKNALEIYGNADVLIGLEYQVKTNDDGVIETVTVTGYPAKYVNFRHPEETVWLNSDYIFSDK